MKTSFDWEAKTWPIPFVDTRRGWQVKLCDPLTTFAIPERFCDDVSSRKSAMSQCQSKMFSPRGRSRVANLCWRKDWQKEMFLGFGRDGDDWMLNGNKCLLALHYSQINWLLDSVIGESYSFTHTPVSCCLSPQFHTQSTRAAIGCEFGDRDNNGPSISQLLYTTNVTPSTSQSLL